MSAPTPSNGINVTFIAAMAGVGILTGCAVAIGCMLITILAANPAIAIIGLGLIYAAIGIAIETGKL